MLRVYIKHPVTGVENEYAARLRPDNKFEPGAKLFNGEADLGDILLDDADGTLDHLVALAGKRRIRVTEDASGAEKTILVGRIASKEFDRGHFRSGRGREFTISIEDANADLRGIPVHNFKRPAETGYARALATLAAYLNGSSSTVLDPAGDPYGRASTIIPATYVQNAGNVSMAAETYSGTDPLSVLRACAEWENKRLGVYIADDGTTPLYYAPKTETSQLNCTISVSDNEADWGSLCFAPNWIAGPALHTDADETVTGLLLIHPDGLTYARRTAAEAIHDRWEEAVYSTQPKAQGANEIAALLDARQVEQPRRQFAIRLPAAKIHLVKAGMRMQVISAAASAIDAAASFRVVNVRYAFLSPDDSENQYHVIVTLDTPVKVGNTWPRRAVDPHAGAGNPIYGGGATETSFFATFRVYLTAGCDATLEAVWEGTAWAAVVFLTGDVGHPGTPTFQGLIPYASGYSVLSADPVSVGFHTVTIGITGTTRYVTLDGVLNTITAVGSEWPPFLGAGAGTGNVAIRVANNNAGGIDATQRIEIDSITGVGVLDSFNRVNASDWGSGWAASGAPPGVWNVDGNVGTIYSAATFVEKLVALSEVGPEGATVIGSTGHDYTYIVTADGATSAWTFPYPYLPGTLRVWVDGNLQNATEVDPSTGDFSLSWMPASGDQVKAIATLPP